MIRKPDGGIQRPHPCVMSPWSEQRVKHVCATNSPGARVGVALLGRWVASRPGGTYLFTQLRAADALPPPQPPNALRAPVPTCPLPANEQPPDGQPANQNAGRNAHTSAILIYFTAVKCKHLLGCILWIHTGGECGDWLRHRGGVGRDPLGKLTSEGWLAGCCVIQAPMHSAR